MANTDYSIIEPTNPKYQKLVAWLLLGGLLFIRIPFTLVARLLTPAKWVIAAVEISSYLLIAIFVYCERSRLAEYHIDTLVVWIILFCKPLNTVILALWNFKTNALTLPNWPSLIIWLIAILLAVALWRKRSELPRFKMASLKWFGIGLVVALLYELLIAYPGSLTLTAAQISETHPSLFGIQGVLNLALYNIGSAAITEEPVFRGILWGLLRKSGWKNVWIWLLQAGLFWIAHLYFLKMTPFTFWVTVPVAALVLGALAWRSKTLASSMAAHGLINGIGMASWVIAAQLLR